MGFNPFINDSGGGGGVGPRGPKGPAGKSAYQIWLEEGNIGTKQDFLDSLKGEPGPAGPQGPQGVKGETGSQGPQGKEGAAGAKGETGNGIDDIEKTSTSGKVDTYTINFTDGTTSTFSVTNGTDGQNGQPGKDGADGANGQPGQDGADGVSVTDVEVNSSNHLIVTLSDSSEIDAGEVQGRLTVLNYGTSTWNDFLTAYRNSTLVYCKAYSTGSQTRLAFMAYVDNDTKPTQVEFQYYRSVSNKNLSNQCDQVIIYKLESNGTWTTTTRNTDVKFAAGDGLAANYANNTLTFAHTNSVTAKTTQGFAQIAYDAQGHITGSTAATTAQADAINSGITSTGVAQITTNKNNILSIYGTNVKNLWNVTLGELKQYNTGGTWSGNVYTIPDTTVTATFNSDGTITINGTPATNKTFNLGQVLPKFKGCIFSACPPTGGSSTTYRAGVNYVGYDEGNGLLLNNDVQRLAQIELKANYAFNNLVFSPMICTQTAWNFSRSYQPYAMSNAELTAKEQVNENNISYNTNQSVKNLFNNIATAGSGNRVTYTPNADKSGTITTESTGAAAPVYFDLGSVTLPSGSYILSGGVSADVSLRDSNNTYVDEGNGATITLSQSATISLRIRVATGYTNTTGVTVYPMIRSAIISDTTYQPYAMSNAELTSGVLLSLIMPFATNNYNVSNLGVRANANIDTSTGIITQTTTDTQTHLRFQMSAFNGNTLVRFLTEQIIMTNNGVYYLTFTKSSDYDTLVFGHNGSTQDFKVTLPISALSNGDYILKINILNCIQANGVYSFNDIAIVKKTGAYIV